MSFVQLTLFVEALLEEGCLLIVVRAKDRFNKPLDSGYRDMLLNVQLKGSEHVGELQLHLRTIIDIKEAAHRTYALMRAVGWEDDNLEDEEEGGEEEDAGVEMIEVGGAAADFEVKVNPLHLVGGDVEMGRRKRDEPEERWDKRFGSVGQLSAEAQERAVERESTVISGHEWDASAAPKRRSSLFLAQAATDPRVAASGADGAAGGTTNRSLRRSQTMEGTTMRAVLRNTTASLVTRDKQSKGGATAI